MSGDPRGGVATPPPPSFAIGPRGCAAPPPLSSPANRAAPPPPPSPATCQLCCKHQSKFFNCMVYDIFVVL